MGQPGHDRGLPQPGQLTTGEELLGYHNNNWKFLKTDQNGVRVWVASQGQGQASLHQQLTVKKVE